MPSRDVNAATRLAEASWRLDNTAYGGARFILFVYF